MQLLDDYIKSEIQKPFIWGETDCCSTVNRWVKIATGVSILNDRSPSKEWLNQINMLIEASKFIKNAGFILTKKPAIGDFGLVLDDKTKLVSMAIKIQHNVWFYKTEVGSFACRPKIVIKSWKLR